MEGVALALVALVCPLGMGLCLWMMARGMKRDSKKGETAQAGKPSLGELRSEQDRLAAEIARLEREQGNGADSLPRRDAPVQRA